MRKWGTRKGAGISGGILGMAMLAAGLVAAPAAQAASCPTGWGSGPKTATVVNDTTTMTGIRAGSTSCYDRVVIDLHGAPEGYRVSYVSGFVGIGSGEPIAARGGAKLLVSVDSPGYDPETGAATYRPANRRELVSASGRRTLRQAVWLGSFEGMSEVGLGVRARLPFRVFVLDEPGPGSRLVVDIAHSW